ncbi:MAG: mechanosensitive ion channel family protein [Planctomycetes bacterium]|nr:mechanosensitive ion channel family protein [Planctomycetota bacterium]
MAKQTRRLLMVLAVGVGLYVVQHCLAQDDPQTTGADAAATQPTEPTTQPPPPLPKPVPKAFDSPASTLRTFITAMNEPVDEEQAVKCLDLTIEGEETARDNADRLFDVLNRIEEVRYWQHPSADVLAPGAQHADLTNYLFFPRVPDHSWVNWRADIGDHQIVLAKTEDGWWKFSAETVAGISELRDRVRHLPVLEGLVDVTERSLTMWFESKLPDALVDGKFLKVKYWQWIGLFALILIGVILDLCVRFLAAMLSRRIIARKEGEATTETIRKTVRPFGLAVAALFWLVAIRLLDLPSEALKVLLPAVRFFVMLAGVWAAFRVTDLIGEFFASKAAKTETKIDDLLVPLVRKTVKIFIFIFGLIYIADSLKIEIAPLLAGLGIGGIGFAFAARDTLENFFGSVTVIVDRPFQIGDMVQIGDVEGTVEDLGFRSTRIRTFYNSLVTIPNGNLVRANVDNFGKRRYRRWKTHIAITYDTPPQKIEAFCEGIRELIRLHPYTRKDYYQVWLNQFGPSSLDVLVYTFYEAPDWSTELRERHRLIVDIIRLANRLGVAFAFPTQTLHLYRESDDATHTPAPAPFAGQQRQVMREGRAAVRELTGNAEWRKRKPGPHLIGQPEPIDRDDDDDTQIESKVGGDT